MFKEWLKQFFALFLSIVIVLSPISHVYKVLAADYILNDTSEEDEDEQTYDAKYYIIDGKDVDDLFDFGLYDIPDMLSWVFQFRTFTVMKEFEQDGETKYKMYFNTPNVQTLLKNGIASSVNDGYTDETWDVNDTQWLVTVGKQAIGENEEEDLSKENVINKYGFNIPSYLYYGEYPKEVMSTAGIIPEPKKWYQVLWRAITSIFGASFLEAPDADNYNTITYLNHTYKDTSDFVVTFLQNYYLDYFEYKIPTRRLDGERYFEDAEEVIALCTTKDEYDLAEEYNDAHEDQYEYICQKEKVWKYYSTHNYDMISTLNYFQDLEGFDVDEKDIYHYIASSTERYLNSFKSFVLNHPTTIYMLLDMLNEEDRYLVTGHGGFFTDDIDGPSDYGMSSSGFDDEEILTYDGEMTFSTTYFDLLFGKANNKISSISADLQRYIFDHLYVHIKYDEQVTSYIYSRSKTENKDGTITYGLWSKVNEINVTNKDKEDNVSYHTTDPYRHNSSYVYNFSVPQSGFNTTSDTTGIASIYKRYNYRLEWAWDKDNMDDSHHIDIAEVIDYCDYLRFENFVNNKFDPKKYEPSEAVPVITEEYTHFLEEDFIPEDESTIYHTYLENEKTIDNYIKFITMLDLGEDYDDPTDLKEILYRQCMITNEGDDEECWSQKYGGEKKEKTVMTMMHVYAFSGIYKITEHYDRYTPNQQLTTEEVHTILTTLKSYCGPYYTEVLANIIKLICATAKHDGHEEVYKNVIKDDARIMPYDVNTLLAVDRENYDVADPRVEMYKSHIIGSFVSDLSLGGSLFYYFGIQPKIISLAGTITEVSVFMQQFCNFTAIEDFGLSPASLWKQSYVSLLLMVLAAFFLIKTAISVIKQGVKGFKYVVIGFLVLIFEMAFVVAIAADPENTWEITKNVVNVVINAGENLTVGNDPNLAYLYGDAHANEVTYYMPYLDTWSKYNTGYGIMSKEQLIDDTRDKAELEESNRHDEDYSVLPYIGEPDSSSEVNHWSVVLADAFSFYGKSTSVTNANLYNGRLINGMIINNNAYRVVDHFLAPRLEIHEIDETTRNFTVSQNENYNGEYQSGFIDLIVKLLNCALCCLLSLIKFMTFMWQWFVFYIFIFRAILGKTVEQRPTLDVIIETFAPTLAMFCIGLYNGIVMQMGMRAEGLLGIFVLVFLFFVTFKAIGFWHGITIRCGQRSKGVTVFPKTLGWLYILTNIRDFKRSRESDKLSREEQLYQQKYDTNAFGIMRLSNEEFNDPIKRTELVFDEHGVIRPEVLRFDSQSDTYGHYTRAWYEYITKLAEQGRLDLNQEPYRTAMTSYKSSPFYSGRGNDEDSDSNSENQQKKCKKKQNSDDEKNE